MKKFLMRRLGVSDDPTVYRPSLHDCIEAVLEQSGELIDDVIKGLITSVQPNQARVSQINQRAISHGALEMLSRNAEAVRETFTVQLRVAIYQSGSGNSGRESLVRFEDLQLLDESTINTNIEYAMAQQELQMAVEQVLPSLNLLISSLLGWLSVQAHLNPLRPETFARALRECLVQHIPSEEARTSLIIPAAGVLGNSLKRLYKELVDWLRSQGIEPVVPLNLSPVSSEDPNNKVAQNSVTRTILTLDKLRRLLSGELDSAGMNDFMHTVPASMVALEDLKMVEPMMKRLSQRAAQSPKHTSGNEKAESREKNQSRKLGRQLGEEVVRLMLDNLMADERLLPKIREQVKALEPVLLKLSKSDPRFFSERKHPARVLLDRITHLSLGYQSERDDGFYAFLKRVDAGVKELLDSQGESESFARVLMMLEEQWQRADQEKRPKQEEAARALMHAEQRNLLAHRLAVDFHQRMDGKSIPELITAFVCGPWSQVVAESQLRISDGSTDSQGYLALVDDLIWSVQVKLARRNRSRLVKLVPNLLVKLRQGLQLIEYPPERIPRFFDELIALHEKAFEGPRVKPAKSEKTEKSSKSAKPTAPDKSPSGYVPLPEEDPMDGMDVQEMEMSDEFMADSDSLISELGLDEANDAESVWVAEHEANEAGYLPEGAVIPQSQSATGLPNSWSASDLAIGAWVELMLKGEWVRAQLTWASPHRTLFMFISGKGLAHSMSRRTMDRLRNRGLMRVVAENHVVDSALDGVAQTALRNDRANR
jgi:hypothetical protein